MYMIQGQVLLDTRDTLQAGNSVLGLYTLHEGRRAEAEGAKHALRQQRGGCGQGPG